MCTRSTSRWLRRSHRRCIYRSHAVGRDLTRLDLLLRVLPSGFEFRFRLRVRGAYFLLDSTRLDSLTLLLLLLLSSLLPLPLPLPELLPLLLRKEAEMGRDETRRDTRVGPVGLDISLRSAGLSLFAA